MRPVLLVALVACTGEEPKPGGGGTGEPDVVDSGGADDTDDAAPECPPGDASGLPVGDQQCAGGVCEIAAGPFWMGEAGGQADACPPREITLSAYAIDAWEVTTLSYSWCVEAGACDPIPDQCTDWLDTLEDSGDGTPAICVDWQQAQDFCAWRGGRLPTEAEWEKAARGEQGATWAWGAAAPDCDVANFRFSGWYCYAGPRPVAHHYEVRSVFGLWDTAGNVWEWTADWYDAGAYAEMAAQDPVGPDGAACRDTVDSPAERCTERVMRGGAFNTTEATTRGSARSAAVPTLVDTNIGFRCAYDR